MKKIILMMFLFVLSMTFFTCSLVCAMTTDEYTDKAYALIEEQRFDDALELLKEAYEQDPGNIGLVFAFIFIFTHRFNDIDHQLGTASGIFLLQK